MLYKNPRGIGCDKCHGKKGEGSLIASYKEFNKTNEQKYDVNLTAPAINNLTLQELADGIHDKKGVMPTYFLTQDEIIAIYKYLKEKK
ncbi:MAG: c-type cytochrome [Campylobacteraceae bacterium]|nr:c-type cytochrome [Campylobacteraceae bacterium]